MTNAKDYKAYCMFDQKMHLGASGPLCVCKTKEEVEVKDRIVQIKSLLLMVRWKLLSVTLSDPE